MSEAVRTFYGRHVLKGLLGWTALSAREQRALDDLRSGKLRIAPRPALAQWSIVAGVATIRCVSGLGALAVVRYLPGLSSMPSRKRTALVTRMLRAAFSVMACQGGLRALKDESLGNDLYVTHNALSRWYKCFLNGMMIGDSIELMWHRAFLDVATTFDIWLHHVVAVIMLSWSIHKDRFDWAMSMANCIEILVPIGFAFHFVKRLAKARPDWARTLQPMFRVIRVAGLLCLSAWRIPSWLSVARATYRWKTILDPVNDVTTLEKAYIFFGQACGVGLDCYWLRMYYRATLHLKAKT